MAAAEPQGPQPTAGEAASEAASDAVNQGATGGRPLGESPASVTSDSDAYDEHPEIFVGAAFVGGLALALILKRVTR
jgi:hypothetical protein